MSQDKEVAIEKAESTRKTVVPKTTERGQPRVTSTSAMIEDVKREELSMRNRLCTFDSMLLDEAVYKGVDLTNLFVNKALYNGKVVGQVGSNKSKVAADFINYCLHNMSYDTWLNAIIDMTSALKYGWSDLNIVLEKRTYGEYAGSFCLRKLSPRDQKSVYGWLWNESQTEWQGFVQKPPLKQRKAGKNYNWNEGLSALAAAKSYDQTYPIIRAEEVLHTSYNTSLSNPQGDSPLLHCFAPWYEKQLVQSYEISGVSKDLAGIPVLSLPSEILEMAADPKNYPEVAKRVSELEQDMLDVHQGKSTHLILQSDRDPVTKEKLFDFELLGVKGGTKVYDTSSIIAEKKKAIYNCFGAAMLLLGQDGSGSYALSSSHTSIHGHHVERDIMQYVDVINTQLIPRLLAANGIYLNYKDMPKFEAGDPDEISLDDLGKIVQRMASVSMMTEPMLRTLALKAGLPEEDIENLDFTFSNMQSRAGDGMKTAGEGTALSVGGGDKSVANSANGGSMQKSLVSQKGTDRIIDTETDECVNEHLLDKDGNYKDA